MDYESVESFSKEIFNVIWYKHGLSLSAHSRNEVLKNHAHFHCAEAIAKAVICKQHIYRVSYKDFFIRNFPDFIVTKNLFRKFIFDLTRQICTYKYYDYFEKLWSTCAFVAEMHLFCLSRALDVNLKAAPDLWTEVVFRSLEEDCSKISWDEVTSEATSRYSKLYFLLEPFMLPRTPYRTVLLIDHLSTLLRGTNAFLQSDEFTPDVLPDEILLLVKELCFALEASDGLISLIKLEHLNKIEVTPPIPEHDYKFLDAVLLNLAPATEEDSDEDSNSLTDVANIVSNKSNVPSAPIGRPLEIPETDLATAAKRSVKDGKSKESSLKSRIETGKNLGRRGTSIQLKESKIKTFSTEQGSSIRSVQLKTQSRKSFPAFASRPGTRKDLDNTDKLESRSKKHSLDVKSIPKTRSTVCSSGAKSDTKIGIPASTPEEKKIRKTRSTALSLTAAFTLKTRITAPSSAAASTSTAPSPVSSSVAAMEQKTRRVVTSSVALSTPKTGSKAPPSAIALTSKTREAVSSSNAAMTPKLRSAVSSSVGPPTPRTRSDVSSSVTTSTPNTRSQALSSNTKLTRNTRGTAFSSNVRSTPKK